MSTRITKRRKLDDQESHHTDRLTCLPDNIIHQILHLLPTTEAFTSRHLCKNWFNAWAYDPILDFDYNTIQPRNMVDVVHGTLSQLKKNSLVHKFRLYSYIFGEEARRIDHWLNFVVLRNVQELEIDTITNDMPYTLSQGVLRCGKSITILKLANLKLEVDLGSVKLMSLVNFSLERIKIDEESAYNLISGCHSLEHLKLVFCFGFETLCVSNPNLKTIDVSHCPSCRSIDVEKATSLQSFSYSGFSRSIGDFKLARSLLKLSIFVGVLKDEELLENISQLPLLERLSLNWRGGLSPMKIGGRRLKYLALVSRSWNVDVEVNAPELVSLEYPRLFISITSLFAPKLLVS